MRRQIEVTQTVKGVAADGRQGLKCHDPVSDPVGAPGIWFENPIEECALLRPFWGLAKILACTPLPTLG